jgi:hypothetical protein
MSGTDPAVREAQVLARYLTGRPASPYVTECFRRARDGAARADDALDRLLLRAASTGRPLATLADAYARLARPGGGFRRRVTLALAVLENAPESHAAFQPAPPASAGLAALRLAGALAGGALAQAAGALLFALPHLALRVARRGGA